VGKQKNEPTKPPPLTPPTPPSPHPPPGDAEQDVDAVAPEARRCGAPNRKNGSWGTDESRAARRKPAIAAASMRPQWTAIRSGVSRPFRPSQPEGPAAAGIVMPSATCTSADPAGAANDGIMRDESAFARRTHAQREILVEILSQASYAPAVTRRRDSSRRRPAGRRGEDSGAATRYAGDAGPDISSARGCFFWQACDRAPGRGAHS